MSRPRGNAVVFDFAWDAAANQFSPIGTPDGYNARDAGRLYVLRDLTPQSDTDFSYALQFPDGITQVFGGSDGYIQSVHDSDGLSTTIAAALFNATFGGLADTGPFPTAPIAGPRYDVTLNWSGGQLGSVTYDAGNGEVFTTTLACNAQNWD